jgi:hypothetical protein
LQQQDQTGEPNVRDIAGMGTSALGSHDDLVLTPNPSTLKKMMFKRKSRMFRSLLEGRKMQQLLNPP